MSLDHSSLPDDLESNVLETPRCRLRRERRELEDERVGFTRFHERIRELEPMHPQHVDSSRRSIQRTTGISVVRTAYTETVMSVPHYLDRYDESVAEHMGQELSDELAIAVTRGTQLHPRLKRSLVEAVEQAIDARETLLEQIDDEREHLNRAEETLKELLDELRSLTEQPIDQLEFNALRLTRVRLHALRDRCDDLAARRQAFVRNQHNQALMTDEAVCSYFYGGCGTIRPILSVIATIGDSIERVLRRVERNLVAAT